MSYLGIASMFISAVVGYSVSLSECPSQCYVGVTGPVCPPGVTVDEPAYGPDGNGQCKCDDGTCEFVSDCNKSYTYTIHAGVGNVLCKGETSFGNNETVTLTVDGCGKQDAFEFLVRQGDCTGTKVGTVKVKLSCGLCSEATCPRD